MVACLLVSKVYIVNVDAQLLRLPLLLLLDLFTVYWIREVHLEHASRSAVLGAIDVSQSDHFDVTLVTLHESLLFGPLLEELLLLVTVLLTGETYFVVWIVFHGIDLCVDRVLDHSYFTSVIDLNRLRMFRFTGTIFMCTAILLVVVMSIIFSSGRAIFIIYTLLVSRLVLY